MATCRHLKRGTSGSNTMSIGPENFPLLISVSVRVACGISRLVRQDFDDLTRMAEHARHGDSF